MNELIRISEVTINNALVKTVNSRELHSFLGSKRQFSDWIKIKLERLRAKENQDFCSISQSCEKPLGGRPTTEYYVTLDIAKHIAMMENTDRGFEVRDYFIECEKQLLSQPPSILPNFNDPVEAARAWANEVEAKQIALKELEVAKPKVEYYDAVLDSSELLTTTIIAKNHGLTAQKLHEFLHQQRVIYKQGDKWYVYQEHLDKGLMRTRTYLGEDGNTITYFKWTKKGEAFINDLINEEGFLSVIFGRHIAL